MSNKYRYTYEKVLHILCHIAADDLTPDTDVPPMESLSPILLEFNSNITPHNEKTRERIAYYHYYSKFGTDKEKCGIMHGLVPCVFHISEIIKTTPIEDTACSQQSVHSVLDFIKDNYKPYLKPSHICKFPHICEYEMKVRMNASISTTVVAQDQIIKNFKYLNKLIEGHLLKGSQLSEYTSAFNKQPENPLYVGLFRNFEWIEIITRSNVNVSHVAALISQQNVSKKRNRTKIPQKVRQLVWNKNNEPGRNQGVCFTCNDPLAFTDMECSHIVSHVLGGPTTVENLMPCCKTCNRDMGITNLITYKNLIYACV